MRPFLVLLPLLALLVAGCARPDGSPIERDDLAFHVVSTVNGVEPRDGELALVGENGLRVADMNGTLAIGIGPVLAAPGGVIACGPTCDFTRATGGMVVAEGSLLSLNDVALNVAGPDRDAVLYFFDDGRTNGQYIRWWDDATRFHASESLQVDGEVLAVGGPVGTATPAGVATLVDGRPATSSFVFTSALEGNDVAIYLRGSAVLTDGRARIDFPPAFAAIMGNGTITTQVTMTSKGPGLFVSEKAKDHIVVESIAAASGVTFDYFVQAPRAGGERFSTLR